MKAEQISKTKTGIKQIRYQTDRFSGKYAVIEYIRSGETKPFRTRIIHGV